MRQLFRDKRPNDSYVDKWKCWRSGVRDPRFFKQIEVKMFLEIRKDFHWSYIFEICRFLPLYIFGYRMFVHDGVVSHVSTALLGSVLADSTSFLVNFSKDMCLLKKFQKYHRRPNATYIFFFSIQTDSCGYIESRYVLENEWYIYKIKKKFHYNICIFTTITKAICN